MKGVLEGSLVIYDGPGRVATGGGSSSDAHEPRRPGSYPDGATTVLNRMVDPFCAFMDTSRLEGLVSVKDSIWRLNR
jgi:hypothetical protein